MNWLRNKLDFWARYLRLLDQNRYLQRLVKEQHWQIQDLNSQLCREKMKRIGIEEGHRWGQP